MSNVSRVHPPSVQPGIPRLGELKPGWKRVKIGDLFVEVNRSMRMNDTDEYVLVTVKRSRGGVEKRGAKAGKDISVKTQKYVEEGDFLISKRQIVHGACGIVPADLAGSIVSNEYSVLNCKDGFDLNFLNYLSHTVYFQQTCFHSSIGVHIEKMIFKLDVWFHLKIDVPPFPEQQKIAAFLGAVDNKLTALRRKRELLQEFKRGMMQKIFSRELRFKREDGSDFPDWGEKRLGEAAKVNPNSKTLPDEFTYIDLDIVNKGVLNNPRTVQKSASPSRAQRLLDREDILFQMVRPYQRNNYYFNLTGNYVASTGYAQLRAKSSSMFLYQLLHANSFVEKVLERCTGTSYPAINSNDLAKICISLPGDVAEQQKIADFLSAIDSKIESVAKQIGQVETFKKGLLQKMFV